jgi:hypothetical protein
VSRLQADFKARQAATNGTSQAVFDKLWVVMNETPNSKRNCKTSRWEQHSGPLVLCNGRAQAG